MAISSKPTSPGPEPEGQLSPIPEVSVEQEPEQVPQPAYGEQYGWIDIRDGNLNTNVRVADDGRLNVRIEDQGNRLSSVLTPVLSHAHEPPETQPSTLSGAEAQIPPLNIVVHIVGSRGDVQPFLALGQELKKFGHRVRIATHPNFRDFVEQSGLEFFSIGGDPSELMAFMVKNPGLMPGFDSLRNGDVGKRRKEIGQIISGCWRSCFEAGDGTGPPITDADFEGLETDAKPFVADAIIANPPSFAHIHCAEKLGIPLHLMFTMPWSPTQAFPHPLVNIQFSNADVQVANFVSYALMEMMTWQGLGDIINRFRQNKLGLEPISIVWAPALIHRLRIPYTYCWSPALIPKPKDWGNHIDISGFFFLPLGSDYTPPDDLAEFLAAGPPPVYIGFGSIVVPDPDLLTTLIFDAIKLSGQRAIVSKGWGGFGENITIPDSVYMIGNCPHDWLFKRVSCVVHHGGAGTTAAGIALGKPTIIVPFFGDQPFWGSMVAKAGAGPHPIPHKQLTSEILAEAITDALEPSVRLRAEELGAKISRESGLQEGVWSFHKHLHVNALRCMLDPRRPASWRVRHTDIRLSSFAATTLIDEGLLDLERLKLYRPKEYDTAPGPRDPVTGAAAALIGSIGDFVMSFADLKTDLLKVVLPNNQVEEDGTPKQPDAKSSKTSVDNVPTEDKKVASSGASEVSKAGSEETPSEPTTDSGEETAPSNKEETKEASGISRDARPEATSSRTSDMATQIPKVTQDVVGASKAASKFVGTGFKSPMDFTLALSKGFHNAPRLYGDTTVRETPRVTGIKSGLKAAGKEFGYGMYDGITGLVTHPLKARDQGPAGILKGIGKGIGGLIFKPGAGAWAIPGYAMSGIYREIHNLFGKSVENYIIASRLSQGYEEFQLSTQGERDEIVGRWNDFLVNPKKDSHGLRLAEFESASRAFVDSLRRPKENEQDTEKGKKSKPTSAESIVPEDYRASLRLAKNKLFGLVSKSRLQTPTPDECERAIHESVQASSTGNAEEDRIIECALRASVDELRAAEESGDKRNAYNRAIEASVLEARRIREEHASRVWRRDNPGNPPPLPPRDNPNDDEELRHVLEESSRTHLEEQERDRAELDALTEFAIWKSLRDSSGPMEGEQQRSSEG